MLYEVITLDHLPRNATGKLPREVRESLLATRGNPAEDLTP